jgi:hypothetical protein
MSTYRIGGKGFLITGDFTAEQARQMAEGMSAPGKIVYLEPGTQVQPLGNVSMGDFLHDLKRQARHVRIDTRAVTRIRSDISKMIAAMMDAARKIGMQSEELIIDVDKIELTFFADNSAYGEAMRHDPVVANTPDDYCVYNIDWRAEQQCPYLIAKYTIMPRGENFNEDYMSGAELKRRADEYLLRKLREEECDEVVI